MYCAECGGHVPEGDIHCPFCGTPNPSASAPASPVEESPELQAERAFEEQLYKWPWVTTVLVAACVGIWLLMEWLGSSEDPLLLIAFGAKNRSLILEGEIWRLLSAGFLHIGYMHLLFNIIALVQLGLFCENIFGRPRYLFLYVASSAGGFALASALSQALSAGASASLFGLMGSMLVFGWRHQGEMPPFFQRLFTWLLLPWVVVNLLVGYFLTNVDNYAHMGGLVSGILITLILGNQILKPEGAPPGRRGLGLGALSLGLILLTAGIITLNMGSYLGVLDTLEEAADSQDGPAFVEGMTQLVEMHPEEGILYSNRAEGHIAAGDIAAAEADLRAAMELELRPGAIQNRLSWMLLNRGDGTPATLKTALELARQSVGQNAHAGNLNTLGYALLLNGELRGAKSRFEQALRRSTPRGVLGTLEGIWGDMTGDDTEPGSPSDLLMLAITQGALGDQISARAYLKRGEAAAALTLDSLEESAAPRPEMSPLERLSGNDAPPVDRLLSLDELEILQGLLAEAQRAVK